MRAWSIRGWGVRSWGREGLWFEGLGCGRARPTAPPPRAFSRGPCREHSGYMFPVSLHLTPWGVWIKSHNKEAPILGGHL